MMSETEKFRIAIIGSGPIGKLLLSSVTPHPRVTYSIYEQETLPLRPSFGYGVGPQTLISALRLNPALGDELLRQCITGPVWMNFHHGGIEDQDLPPIEVPEGQLYGRIGREELLDLLDSFRPKHCEPIQYGKTLKSVTKVPGELKLEFADGAEERANALLGCDGMNSLCRKLIQGPEYKPAKYSGMVVFRGKVPCQKVSEAVGERFATETYMFIGVKGWHVLIFPIAGGKFVNIAAFAEEAIHKKRGRTYKTSTEELLTYFSGANATVQTLLRILNDQPDGCVCLELMAVEKLGKFYNEDLCMTSFGDAANGMLPHIAGSMSTGFIGVTTFLRDELNPRFQALGPNASNDEIAEALMEASANYQAKHQPLSQKLADYSAEQGSVFAGGVLDVDELSMRPRFLWQAAGSQMLKD
ncbi:hypothetical protein F5884DRAFT_694525 [Xylogone sp. PMI_703]|nr:hypothetical protein F5884DRAFT_694525 [Xylogone sp. PMI_703]